MKYDQPPSSGKPPAPVEPAGSPPAAADEGNTFSSEPGESAVTLDPPTEGAGSPLAGPFAPGLPRRLPAMFGRYRLLKPLGKGGMGVVYLAHDTQLDRPVALKVPFFKPADGPQAKERFLREARSAATLRHANLCPVYDVGHVEDTLYLTMAFIEGQLLSDLVRANPRGLPQRQVAALVRKLALALEEAHRKKVIHRDLKPANIMLTRRGEPVIMDFGLAHRGSTGDERLTQEGVIVGTPAYMAPEQARGNPEETGPACDVYALGVILYELLTGRLPFTGSAMAVLTQAMMDEPSPPSDHRQDLDARLEAICLKALAKKPEFRQRSMGELAMALTEYLKATTQPTLAGADAKPAGPGLLEEALPPTVDLPYRPPLNQLRHRPAQRLPIWGWVAAATGIVALLLLGIIVSVATRKGTIKIELSDPRAQVDIKVDGDAVLLTEGGQTLQLRPGAHGLEVTGKDFKTISREFTVQRGANPVLQVTLEPVLPAPVADPAPEPTVQKPVERQQEAQEALARAEDHLAKKEYAQAQVEASKAIRRDPKLIKAFLVRATAHLNRGKPHEALADATAALELDPASTHALVSRCIARGRLGDVDGGIADATEALRLDGKNYSAYLNRCWLYRVKDDLEHAFQDCEAMLRLRPRHGYGYLERGLLYSKKGEAALAKADFDKAVQLDPALVSKVPVIAAPDPAKPLAANAFVWPAAALREGKIIAPALNQVRPWFTDKFDNPASGFHVGPNRGYQDGNYFIHVAGLGRAMEAIPPERAMPPQPIGDFACEVVGKATGANARWGIAIGERSDTDRSRQISVQLANPGVLYLGIGPKDAELKKLEPQPGEHPAIKKKARTVNTLLVIGKGQLLEVYVNGVAVCDPVPLDRKITAPQLFLVAASPANRGATVHFERVTIWPAKDLIPVENRGAVPIEK